MNSVALIHKTVAKPILVYHEPTKSYAVRGLQPTTYGPRGTMDPIVPRLMCLGWREHPENRTCWYTHNPCTAAPFWHLVDGNDLATVQALGPWAYNYASSFATEPLKASGISEIPIRKGEALYGLQIAGIQRGFLRHKTLNADKPGLGKTVQAIGVANLVKPRRIIVGCPAALCEHWARSFNRFGTVSMPIQVLDRPNKTPASEGLVIVPYSRGHTYHEALLKSGHGGDGEFVILDECHYLKTIGNRRSTPWWGSHNQKIPGIAYLADRVMALSGTPTPNNPFELYPLLHCIGTEALGPMSQARFKERFCVVGEFRGNEVIRNSAQEDELNTILRASGFMTRRHKEDVLTQLPPKNVYLLHLSPTRKIEDLVRQEVTLYEMASLKLMTAQELMALQGHIMSVRRQLGVEKSPKIAEYLVTLFESDERRVICGMVHLEAIALLEKIMKQYDMDVLTITGSVPVRQRQALVDTFQSASPRPMLLICQMEAGGVGLTMTASRYCVCGEIKWEPSSLEQMIDRVHRITQTRQVEAPVITFPHAVEERVLNKHGRKSISAYNVLDANLMQLMQMETR